MALERLRVEWRHARVTGARPA